MTSAIETEAAYRSDEEAMVNRRTEDDEGDHEEAAKERSTSREKESYRSRSRSPKYHRYDDSDKRSSRRRHSPSPTRYHKNVEVKRENPEPSCILGVFGLSARTTKEDLNDLYTQYGTVKQCMIVFDRESGNSRGFGFVYFMDTESAQRALEATNGMDLDGRNIRVAFSVTNRPHSPTPGCYMGRRRSPRNDRDRYDSRRNRYHYRDVFSSS